MHKRMSDGLRHRETDNLVGNPSATDAITTSNSTAVNIDSSANTTSPTTDSAPGSGSGSSKDGAAPPAATGIIAGFAAESTLPLSQSALLAAIYTIGSTAFFLLIRYSKRLEKEGALVYDNAAAVFFMELLKWTFSVSVMYYRTGKFLPVSVFREGTWRTGLYYAAPSLIYAVYNNLTYYNLTMFDPTTFQVFIQTRVLFTGVLYSWIFHKLLSSRKWAALILLTVGVASKYLKFPLQSDIDWHIVFLLFQASLSAFAGVYNEFLLKRDISMDVNEQNFFMYSFALFFNLGFGLWSMPDYYTSGKVFSNVGNHIFFWIVVTGATMGISASMVLKFINVIVKAFASATEVLVTAVLAWFFLGESLTGKDLLACLLVTVSIYTYYSEAPAPAAQPPK